MTQRTRFVGAYIASVAMLLHALMPVGWMPNTTGKGSSLIVICTMNGPAQQEVGADGQPTKQHNHDQGGSHDHQVCPFAAAAHFATPTNAAALVSPVSTSATNVQIAQSDALAFRTAHSPHAPRAPPRTIV